MQTADFNMEFGVPTWFGPSDSGLFGWHHYPSNTKKNAAVIICAPFGHEYMVTYRSLRKLAGHLADHGYHTFRFDYHGTGDSIGLASDQGRLEAWTVSTSFAVSEVRRVSKCDKVILIGLRLGATIAALVSKRSNVDSIIMLNPVVSGRKYARELVAFAGMKNAQTDSSGHTVISEVVGYPLTDETKHELSKIDLIQPNSCRIKKCLIIARSDLPGGETKLASALHAEGVNVQLKDDLGFSGMLSDDAYDSKVPETLWTMVSDWISENYALGSDGPFANVPMSSQETKFRLGPAEIIEKVIILNGVTAIITAPADQVHFERPTILISNTGANHRVGNHRLCVNMARSWCARGFMVIRYDRPGTGDSLIRPGGSENDIYSSSGLAALRELMDFIEDNYGTSGFILAGLCSGAYFSYQAAIDDHRVKGLLMINPLTYHWREGDSIARPERRVIYKSTDFYLDAVKKTDTWRRLFKGHIDLGGIATTLGNRVIKKANNQWRTSLAWALRHEPAVSVVGQSFIDLESRGVEIFMVFDAAEGGIDLMETHMQKNAGLMRNRRRFRLEIVPGADHTFTPLWSQSHIINMIGEHFYSRFSG